MIWSYNQRGYYIKSLNRVGTTENRMRQKLLNLLINTKKYIKERKRLFFLLIFFSFIYLVIEVLSKASAAFLSFELGLIFMLVGMAPAYYLRNIFPFRNIVGWLTNASMFGLILFHYSFYFWMVTSEFRFSYSINLLRFLAIVSLLVIVLFVKRDFLKEYISFRGLTFLIIYSTD